MYKEIVFKNPTEARSAREKAKNEFGTTKEQIKQNGNVLSITNVGKNMGKEICRYLISLT